MASHRIGVVTLTLRYAPVLYEKAVPSARGCTRPTAPTQQSTAVSSRDVKSVEHPLATATPAGAGGRNARETVAAKHPATGERFELF